MTASQTAKSIAVTAAVIAALAGILPAPHAARTAVSGHQKMTAKRTTADLAVAAVIAGILAILAAMFALGTSHKIEFESVSRAIEIIETTEHGCCDIAGIEL